MDLCGISAHILSIIKLSFGCIIHHTRNMRKMTRINSVVGVWPNTSRLNTTKVQGLYALSGKTSCRQISWSLEAARLNVAMVVSLWNLTGTSAAVLPRYLPNFRAIGKVLTRISGLRGFTRSYGKTSYRLVNRGPEWCCWLCLLRVSEMWQLFAPEIRRKVNPFSESNFKQGRIDHSWYIFYFFIRFGHEY